MNHESDFKLEEWEAAAGKIVTSISRVEGEILLKYEEHLSRSMFFKKDVTLNRRLNRIENLHDEICGETIYSKSLFDAIREQVKLRNLVAHNPVYYDSENDSFNITNSQSRNTSINVAELQELSKKAFIIGTKLTILLRVWKKNKS